MGNKFLRYWMFVWIMLVESKDKIMSNIDTNIRVCFLTGYDIKVSDYPDLPVNKNKIMLNPVLMTQLLQVIRALLNEDNSKAS